MTDGLPDGRQMWIRAFYGFDPSEAGYVGWSQESGQKRALSQLNDGDLILIYGASSGSTRKEMRGHVIGFVEIEARPIRDHEKSSEGYLVGKAAGPNAGKWSYGLPIRRAWKAHDLMPIERIATETYDKVAAQGIGVWGRALTPAEIETALKIKVTEIDVFGDDPVGPGALAKQVFAEEFQPSRGFPGTSGPRTSEYEDGETHLYLAVFNGDGHALLGRHRGFGDKNGALKIGVTNDLTERAKQLNSGIPPASVGRWEKRLHATYPNRKTVEAAEQHFKDNHAPKLESLGGEFFWGDITDAELVWSATPGVSRF